MSTATRYRRYLSRGADSWRQAAPLEGDAAFETRWVSGGPRRRVNPRSESAFRRWFSWAPGAGTRLALRPGMRNETTRGNLNQRKRPRRVRTVGLSVLLALGLPCTAWMLLHRVPGAAPAAADAARAVVGDEAVAALEDGLYAIEDGVKRRIYAGAAPQAHWRVDPARVPAKSTATVAAARAPTGGEQTPPAPPVFHPKDVGALYPKQHAEGDGVWLAAEPEPIADTPVSFK